MNSRLHQQFLPCFEAEDSTARDLLHCGISKKPLSAVGQSRHIDTPATRTQCPLYCPGSGWPERKRLCRGRIPLGDDNDDPITSNAGDAVAKLIIQLARAGEGDPERLCGRAWMSFASKNAVGCAAVAAHERHKTRTASERGDLRYV
jgi:hypothetical protein